MTKKEKIFMMIQITGPVLIVFLVVFMTLACGVLNHGFVWVNDPEGVQDPNTVETRVAETVQAWKVETMVAYNQTALVPTVTATEGPSPEPSATIQIQPSSTNSPSPSPLPSNTPTSQPKDWAQFVRDVTVSDNTAFTSGASFTKIWRLRNIGTQNWTPDYDLVFVGGDGLSAKSVIPLPRRVAPGETIDLEVNMRAPAQAGTYTGRWQLRNSSDVLFGIGDRANGAFWVKIKVLQPDQDFKQDFVGAYCTADWSSQSGLLACPGDQEDSTGFVRYEDNPALENRHEDQPTLWMRPNKGTSGWIRGIYPAINVKPNDHFLTWIGCLENSRECKLTFQLNYVIDNGAIKNLGEWREVYDGKITQVDVDLSGLAGKEVQIVLTVINRGAWGDANAFWFVPRIQNVRPTPTIAPPTQTPTPTASETPAPTATPTPQLSDHPVVKMAVDRLAGDLGLGAENLFLVTVGIAEWPNTCLGLPTDDEICAPQLTPGFLVIVTYNETSYEIHTNQDGSNIRWVVLKVTIQ